MILKSLLLISCGFILSISADQASTPCKAINYGSNSIVCVCNATYCDSIATPTTIPDGQYHVYTSDRAGSRFAKSEGFFQSNVMKEPFLNIAFINLNATYQSLNGFGGTFTDASVTNINSLNNETKANLLKSYFSEDGINYNAGKVPIGCTEFSSRSYSYDDDNNDTQLLNFTLTTEDTDSKIPLIQEIQENYQKLILTASAWAPPAWMKTNSAMGGPGILKSNMYQAWANYHLKFLEAYKNANLSFWAITTGNEPHKGLESTDFPSLGWLGIQLSVWIGNNFGPTIRNSEFSSVNILTVDDQRSYVKNLADLILTTNPNTKGFVNGIGVHCQDGDPTSADVLSHMQRKYPDEFIISTSAAAVSDNKVSEGVELGNWDHADKYIHGIMEIFNNWGVGWIDSNLALDMKGGPSFVTNNNVEAAIIVDAESQQFFKQPVFYAQGHFSKFLPIGSQRVGIRKIFTDLDMVAFKRPDNGIVVIVHNNKFTEQTVRINDEKRGHIMFTATSRSISTIVYQ